MDVESIIRGKLEQRKADGLCVSFDSDCKTYRCTQTFATIKERDRHIDVYEYIGRNPRIES